MQQELETNKGFVFRLEDVCYCFIFLPFLFVGGIFVAIGLNKQEVDSTALIVASCIFGGGLLFVGFLVYDSWSLRQRERYFIEHDAVVKMSRDIEIFRIPLKDVVSIRVNNRRGTQGTVLLYTNKESLNYWFTYIPFNHIPIDLYGYTKFKINLLTNRKQFITMLVQHNPKLHFIETY